MTSSSKNRCETYFKDKAAWPKRAPEPDWHLGNECGQETDAAVVSEIVQSVVENALAAVNVVARMEAIEIRLADMESRQSRHEQLTTLAPDSLLLSQPIPVSIGFNGDDYVAQFVEAGISATGDTRVDAMWNLRDVIVLKYNRLSEIPAAKLGPVPSRQLAVLRSFIEAK